MKTQTGIKLLSIASLMMVYACGNPHVNVKGAKDRVGLPSIVEPSTLEQALKSPAVSNTGKDGEVSIKTKLPQESKDVQVVNPNAEDSLVISYRVELGENFRLNLGDCEDLIAATKSCTPQVVFFAAQNGIYQDNLIITYRSVKDPTKSKNVIVPLKGEKISDVVLPAEVKAPVITDADGRLEVKFSTKEVGEKQPLVSSNPNESEDLIISYSLESGDAFKLETGDCGLELAKKSSCAPVVVFTATEPGTYKDNLIATYVSKSNPDLSKKVILPIIGEKQIKVTPVNPVEAPVVKTAEGQDHVAFSTLDQESKIPLKVENVDPDDDLIVSYSIESGKNFKIVANNCVEVLETGTSCSPVIHFSAEKPGAYKDNLIVTYASKSRPEIGSKVVVPLTGEKLVIIPTGINLEIVPQLGANSVDFGKSLVDQEISQFITINNPTEYEISLTDKKISGAAFEFGKNGTCKKVIEGLRKCTLEVRFNSSEVGLKAEQLTLSYSSVYGGAVKKVSAKLLGEKIKDLNDCAGGDCGTIKKPGKLEVAGLNGDALNFGEIGLGSAAKQTVPVLNSGELALEIVSIEVSGEGFSATNDCQKVLLPGHCNLQVSFSPKEDRAYSGVIVVTTKDGQKVKIPLSGSGKDKVRCFKKSIHYVSALAEYDMKKVVLPYVNSQAGNAATIQTIYGTKVNSLVRSLNRYTVKDAQVVTTFMIPALSGRIDSVEFTLDTSKVILDGHKDTEAVCLSSASIKKCSGKDFDTKAFLALKNPKFWATFSTPVNDLYEEDLMSGQYKCGEYVCANKKKQYSANKLFDLSESELMSILKDKVVSLVVTDDTRNMTLPSLRITTSQEVACKK